MCGDDDGLLLSVLQSKNWENARINVLLPFDFNLISLYI